MILIHSFGDNTWMTKFPQWNWIKFPIILGSKKHFPKKPFFFLTLKKQIKKPESCGIEQSWVVGVVAQPYELPPWGWSVTLTEQPVTWPPPVVLLGWGGWPPMGDDFLFYYTFRCQEKKNNNDFFGKCYSYWGNSYSLPFWEEWK